MRNTLRVRWEQSFLLFLLSLQSVRSEAQLQTLSFDCHPVDSCDCFCCAVMLDSTDIGNRLFEYRGDSVIVHLDDQHFVLSGDSVIVSKVHREVLIGFNQGSGKGDAFLETSFLDELTTDVAPGFPPLYGRHGEKVEVRFVGKLEENRMDEEDALYEYLSINYFTGNSDWGNGISSSFLTETAVSNLSTHAPPSYIHYVSVVYDRTKGPVSGLIFNWQSCLRNTISDVFSSRSWISSPCR